MIPNIPSRIPMPFAQNGERRDIQDNNTVPGSADASWAVGFPPVTRINKQAGGKPPYGLDFQGIFHALSQHLFFSQSGCVYPWVGADTTSGFPGLNYLKGSHVLGSDGEEYIALKPSGPDVPNADGAGFVGPVDPVGDESGMWQSAKGVYEASIATTQKAGLVKPDGTTITVDASGVIRGSGGYELCELYYFRNPTLRPGFAPCNGGVIQNAATLYPKAWAYLQTTEGQQLCKTEAEWQELSTHIYYYRGDGAGVGFNGVGGVPWFSLNTTAGTMRLPDIRGTYLEPAGKYLNPGQVHIDYIRNITGGVYKIVAYSGATIDAAKSALTFTLNQTGSVFAVSQGGYLGTIDLTLSKNVPVADSTLPHAFGVLPCVYLGDPA